MIRVLTLLLVLFSVDAKAQVVVKSGEHEGFTRLVLNYGRAVTWKVGRDDDGYQVLIEDLQTKYDLSEAFRIIGKSRLASLEVDSLTKRLHFSLACNCHAKAFEFRPGIIVVDIKDGPPQPNSEFENPIALPIARVAIDTHNLTLADDIDVNSKDTGSKFDWVENFVDSQHGQTNRAEQFKAVSASDFDMPDIHANIIEHLSKGATRGIIDIDTDFGNRPVLQDASSAKSEQKSARIFLGGLPGFIVDHEGDLAKTSILGSEYCTAAGTLAIPTWSSEDEVWFQMNASNDGLVGEFDVTDEKAVEKSIKFLLSIGFGAEARQILRSFPTNSTDTAIWESLSYLVDGEDDPKNFFFEQSECDSPSALWSVLDELPTDKFNPINSDAIYSTFSSLSVEMRNRLGPILIEKLLIHKDFSTAEKVRAALTRAPGGQNSRNTLAEASLDLNANDPNSAEEKAQSVLVEGGPETWSALVTLVEARAAQNVQIKNETLVALEAVHREFNGTEAQPNIQHALILAYALSMNFKLAFEALNSSPDTESDVWRLLATLGTDDDILRFAVLPPDSKYPEVELGTAARIVDRLGALGMASSAVLWAADSSAGDDIALANSLLQKGNAEEAIAVLADHQSPEALSLRALALQKLGQSKAAASLYVDAQDIEGEQRSLRQAHDWNLMRKTGPEQWKAAAELLQANKSGAEVRDYGTLSNAKRTVNDARTTLEAVNALLSNQTNG